MKIMEDILLLGMGGHAHSVIDSIERTGKYHIIGFLDKEEMQGKSYRGYNVLGTDDALKNYYDGGVRSAFVTIGFLGHGKVREHLYRQLKDIGYILPNIIDDTVLKAKNVKIGEGVFIGKNAVINAGAEIGDMCIVNTGAVIEHDCRVKGFSHIAVGAVLCGGVAVGEATMIGANATVIHGITVGNNCVVGAGTVIYRDMQDNILRYGTVEKQRDINE